MFLFILGVFLIPYGVVTTALLYPNEMRISESLEGVFFKPILTLYGELFLSEYTTYDFNDPLNGCSATTKLGFLGKSKDQEFVDGFSPSEDHPSSTVCDFSQKPILDFESSNRK